MGRLLASALILSVTLNVTLLLRRHECAAARLTAPQVHATDTSAPPALPEAPARVARTAPTPAPMTDEQLRAYKEMRTSREDEDTPEYSASVAFLHMFEACNALRNASAVAADDLDPRAWIRLAEQYLQLDGEHAQHFRRIGLALLADVATIRRTARRSDLAIIGDRNEDSAFTPYDYAQFEAIASERQEATQRALAPLRSFLADTPRHRCFAENLDDWVSTLPPP